MSELTKLEQSIVAGIGTDTLSVAMEATDAFDSYCEQVRRLQAELAALRRQVAVLEHDRRGLMDALIEQIGADNTLALMNDIRLASMKPAE